MIQPNTIWLSKKNEILRVLGVIPDDEDTFKPDDEQRKIVYACHCYSKDDDGSSGVGFMSVALPVDEWVKNYFPAKPKQ